MTIILKPKSWLKRTVWMPKKKKTEKYITFLVPIKKEIESGKTITYKTKFIDSFRFMSSSLPSLVDNLCEGFHNNKCTGNGSCLECMWTKDDPLVF